MSDIIVKKSKIEGQGVFAHRDFKKGAPGMKMPYKCGSQNCRQIITA